MKKYVSIKLTNGEKFIDNISLYEIIEAIDSMEKNPTILICYAFCDDGTVRYSQSHLDKISLSKKVFVISNILIIEDYIPKKSNNYECLQ